MLGWGHRTLKTYSNILTWVGKLQRVGTPHIKNNLKCSDWGGDTAHENVFKCSYRGGDTAQFQELTYNATI